MANLSRPWALIITLFVASCGGPDSLGSKSEWSVLQGLEYDHRSSVASEPLIRSVSGYRAAGLPRADGPGLVWVLLNPSHAPLYKQLPEGSYRLSEAQLRALRVSQPEVLAELRAHVRE